MVHKCPCLLMADDDLDDRQFFRSAMQRIYPQVRVQSFDDGDQLLEYLNNCPSAFLPTCIFCDYNMSRIGASQLLQATGPGTRYAQIPRIVWSTSTRKEDAEECIRRGAARFVAKPANDAQLDTLLQSLEPWINSAHTYTQVLANIEKNANNA